VASGVTVQLVLTKNKTENNLKNNGKNPGKFTDKKRYHNSVLGN
jgi:hypothetical protein